MSEPKLRHVKGYIPLPKNLYFAESSIHGVGIFASKEIPAGYDFGITHIADKRFPDGYIRTVMGSYVNHSFTPNTQMYEEADTIRMKTIAHIGVNDEITVDYRPFYDKEAVEHFQ